MFTLTIGVQVYVVGSPKKSSSKQKKPCLRLNTGMRSRSRPEQAFFWRELSRAFVLKLKIIMFLKDKDREGGGYILV